MAPDHHHDDAPPPSYQDSLTSNQNTGASHHPPVNRPRPPPPPLAPPLTPPLAPPPQHFSRPPEFSPRPSEASSNPEDLYNPNPKLPFKYPKGHLCSKCKNSGFKLKSGGLCSPCWSKFFSARLVYNPSPELPLRFPPGFVCSKCKNTGYKSSKKTCKDCWELYGPRNDRVVSSGYGVQRLNAPSPYGQPMMGMPMRLPPGDPRLGGVLCGRCRGLGLTHFLLDEELCRVCLGLGRIVSTPPPPPMSIGGAPPQGPFGYPRSTSPSQGPLAPYGPYGDHTPSPGGPVQQGSYGYPPQRYYNDLKR